MEIVSDDFPILRPTAHPASFALYAAMTRSYEQAEATPLAHKMLWFAPTMRLGNVVDPPNNNCPKLEPWTIFGSKPGTCALLPDNLRG
jgi:hypothetical protein